MNNFPPDSSMSAIPRKTRKSHTLKFLKKLIRNTRFDEALDCIANCHKTSGYLPKSMLLCGESGSGKTTVIEYYLESFPAQELPTGRICPVLYIALNERTTVKGILSALLEACGDPRPESGIEGVLSRRLRKKYLPKLKVELIIIDELHHVLPEHSSRRIEEAADLLKTLSDKIKIPFVLAGLPESQKIITLIQEKERSGKQLERRWRRPYYIGAEQYGTTRWKNMVTHYQKKIGVPCITLTTNDMLKRIYVASNGLHDFISKILEETLELSDGIKQIDITLLAKGYDEATSVRRLPENPFLCEMRLIEDLLVTAIGRNEADRDKWDRLLKGEA